MTTRAGPSGSCALRRGPMTSGRVGQTSPWPSCTAGTPGPWSSAGSTQSAAHGPPDGDWVTRPRPTAEKAGPSGNWQSCRSSASEAALPEVPVRRTQWACWAQDRCPASSRPGRACRGRAWTAGQRTSSWCRCSWWPTSVGKSATAWAALSGRPSRVAWLTRSCSSMSTACSARPIWAGVSSSGSTLPSAMLLEPHPRRAGLDPFEQAGGGAARAVPADGPGDLVRGIRMLVHAGVFPFCPEVLTREALNGRPPRC